jgi:rare lipoprotein A
MPRCTPWLKRAAGVVLVALLASCSTTPPGSAPTKKSAYYQDDGPPERLPADIASIPDAVPRVEPPHRAASRSYAALGRTYTPLTGDVSFRQRGMASWYGRQFHGNRTANGEIYDMFGMTAAHPILPLPSYVRVTNIRNGRSVIVRVNDRGPFKHDRVIDLSYAAATKLGIAAAGTGEVEVERITMAQIASGEYRRGDSGVTRSASETPMPTPVTPTSVAPISVAQSASSNPTSSVVVPAALTVPVVSGIPAESSTGTALAATSAREAPATSSGSAGGMRGWAVQLGAFSQEANAEALAGRTAALLAFLEPADALPVRVPRIEKDGAVYRVLVGATPDRDAALSLARELEKVLERPTSLLLR